MHSDNKTAKVRLDKWLWAARLYKTRRISREEIDKGRVRLNGQPAKPSRDVKSGDSLELRSGPLLKIVVIRALSDVRGPAPVAALLYEETAASVALKAAAAEKCRLAPEPAQSLSHGRPTKRNRRELDSMSQGATRIEWNARWSAGMDH